MDSQTSFASSPSAVSGQLAAPRCVSLARERAGLRLRLARAVALFIALNGPGRLGYASRRDYARNALGISPVRILRLRRVGALCLAQPSVAELPFSVIDLLAERLPPDAAPALVPRLRGCTFRDAASVIDGAVEAVDQPSAARTPPDTDFQRVSFSVPTAVAAYLDDTLQVASALLGQEAPEAECIDAVVAEASTEIPEGATVEEARRCFAVSRPRSKPVRPTPAAEPPTPRPRYRRSDQSAALILDRYLIRLLTRERTLATDLEDAILTLSEDQSYLTAGYKTFADFGREALSMPTSTLNDHLSRARLRQREHPIATAVANGTLPPAKAQLIERLHRRCHVPLSCLQPWIDLAQSQSFRGLTEALRWAHTQRNTDYRTWSNEDFRPPQRDEIRASKHPVTEIAQHPDPEILTTTDQQAMTSTRWVLRRETLDVLLQLMAGSRSQTTQSQPPPAWWCLLNVFVTARKQWSQLEREPRGVRGQVLRRDDYRCAVPVCSQRRALEVHHIHFRSAGGDDHPTNLVTLCAFHHKALHEGRLRIKGNVIESTEDLSYELAIDKKGKAQAKFKGETLKP